MLPPIDVVTAGQRGYIDDERLTMVEQRFGSVVNELTAEVRRHRVELRERDEAIESLKGALAQGRPVTPEKVTEVAGIIRSQAVKLLTGDVEAVASSIIQALQG